MMMMREPLVHSSTTIDRLFLSRNGPEVLSSSSSRHLKRKDLTRLEQNGHSGGLKRPYVVGGQGRPCIVRLIAGHLVEGLLELDADLAVSVLPLVELSDKQVQLLLELGGLTLSGGGLDLGELQVHRQISDLLLGLLVALEGVGLGQLKGLHVLADNVELLLEFIDLLLGFLRFIGGAVELNLSHGELSGDL